MPRLHTSLAALLVLLAPLTLAAQQQAATTATIRRDSAASDDADVGEGHRGLQFGVATGGLRYPGGRSEQSLGAVFRWVPVQWLSLSATPTGAHVSEPAAGTAPAASRSGLVDLPLEASVSHAFGGHLTPTVSAGFGVTLPVGDSASGFGAGTMGYSATIGAGFTPVENVWVHGSAGRSLSDFSVQSAYTSGSGWADLSGGTSLNERVSVGAGYSTDIGAYDKTIGRSTSLSGNVALTLRGATTFNVSASHGLGGAAPDWSMVLAIGTAFPYLNHLGAGSSLSTLRNSFGGGTHGLGTGTTIGGAPIGVGRGR